MKRFEHAFWIGLLFCGCVPTDDGGQPSPEGTRAAATPPTAPQPAPGRLQLPQRTARPMPPGPPLAQADAARGVATPNERLPLAVPGQPRPGVKPVRPPAGRAPGGPVAVGVPAAPPAPAKADDAAPDAPIKSVFVDFFERPELGTTWNPTAPSWRIEAGKLCGRSARNHPVWLRRKLPINARIEFDAMSSSPDGDLKVELWGDGKSFAKGTSYTDATSYLAIFGGWKNSYHVLARIDEHAKDRPEVRIDPSGNTLKAARVMPNRWYHFKIERADEKTVRWLVDDIELISFADPNPLKGEGHEHLGFNDWEVPVCFDNLKITPLGG